MLRMGERGTFLPSYSWDKTTSKVRFLSVIIHEFINVSCATVGIIKLFVSEYNVKLFIEDIPNPITTRVSSSVFSNTIMVAKNHYQSTTAFFLQKGQCPSCRHLSS